MSDKTENLVNLTMEAMEVADVAYARVGRAVSEDKPVSEYLDAVKALDEAITDLRVRAGLIVPEKALTLKSQFFRVTIRAKASTGQVDVTNIDLIKEGLDKLGYNFIKGVNLGWTAEQGPVGEVLVGKIRALPKPEAKKQEYTVTCSDLGAYRVQLEITRKYRDLMARCDKAYQDSLIEEVVE